MSSDFIMSEAKKANWEHLYSFRKAKISTSENPVEELVGDEIIVFKKRLVPFGVIMEINATKNEAYSIQYGSGTISKRNFTLLTITDLFSRKLQMVDLITIDDAG